MAIDIPVELDVSRLLQLPPCQDVRLPQPGSISIQLPTGSKLSAIADVSKGVPTDCALTFSLLIQLAPLLGSMECLFKVLKLLKPLIDVINGLPLPPVKALADFAKAAADLAPCLLVPTPASLIPFIRDILCLVLKVLKCFLGQMGTLLEVMSGLSLKIDLARAAGNAALLSALECAQENVQTSMAHLTQSVAPLSVIFELIGPLMGIAGIQPIQLPGLGGGRDVAALRQTIATLQGVVGTIQQVVDALGGCS
jgi:hypothetical protein